MQPITRSTTQTAATKPRFRSDLVAQPVEESGERFVDVIDPDSGRAFRFFEVEYSIACAMDGDRDVPGLVSWARTELGLAPSETELATVITTLSDLGYLDQGGAAPASVEFEMGDDSLVPGVVHGGRRAPLPPTGLDFELGAPGSAQSSDEPLPDAGRLELGAAGLSPEVQAASRGAAQAEDSFADLMDGDAVNEFATPTPPPAEVPMATLQRSMRGLSDDDDDPTMLPAASAGFDDDEVSVDLSTHLSLGTDDLKEAVRASREMKAVDVPAELLAELEGDKAAAMAPGTPGKGIAASLSAVAEAMEEDAGSVPIELPDSPKFLAPASAAKEKAEEAKGKSESAGETAKDQASRAERKATAAEETSSPRSTSGLLVVLLLIVAVAAFAYWYYTNHLQTKTEVAPPPPPVAQIKPPPPAPPPPSATLVETEAPRIEVAAGKSGVVGWVVELDTEVEAGAVLATLRGIRPMESAIRSLQSDIDRYGREIARAEKGLSAPAASERTRAKHQALIDRRKADIAEREAEIARKREEAAAFEITAPSAGTVEALISKHATVNPDSVVATLRGAEVIAGTFTVTPDKKFEIGATVEVASKANPATKGECKVIDLAGDKLTVHCPAGGDISVGDTVILR